MTGINLTDRQRSLLCWLDATDGKLPKEGLKLNNPDLVHELTLTLKALGLIEDDPVYEKDFGWVYRPNEEGRTTAARLRYRQTGCLACIQGFCVCRLRLVCVAGCGSGGCHGSHD